MVQKVLQAVTDCEKQAAQTIKDADVLCAQIEAEAKEKAKAFYDETVAAAKAEAEKMRQTALAESVEYQALEAKKASEKAEALLSSGKEKAEHAADIMISKICKTESEG